MRGPVKSDSSLTMWMMFEIFSVFLRYLHVEL